MIYFTSDWHIGHKNIIRLGERPFTDMAQMKYVIFDNYNSVVRDEDIVYFVGDIFWQYQDAPNVLKYLKGTKVLIIGNHDKCFKPKSRDKYIEFYKDAGFFKVYDSVRVALNGRYVTVNHFPYRIEGAEQTQRYYEHRPINQGDWLIHGHIHQNGFVKDKQINVSVEVWDYKPVSQRTIAQIMNNTYVPTVYQKTRGVEGEKGDAKY